MEVKGTALKTTRDFIKTQFPDQYDKWLDSLTADSRKIILRPLWMQPPGILLGKDI